MSILRNFIESMTIETATGAALDELSRLSRPTGLSDAEVRQLIKDGYYLRIGPVQPDERARRQSPRMELFYREPTYPHPTVMGFVKEAGYRWYQLDPMSIEVWVPAAEYLAARDIIEAFRCIGERICVMIEEL